MCSLCMGETYHLNLSNKQAFLIKSNKITFTNSPARKEEKDKFVTIKNCMNMIDTLKMLGCFNPAFGSDTGKPNIWVILFIYYYFSLINLFICY